jgi:chemotaxis protein CheX
MPATHEISATLIRDNITRAINDVFKTMLNRTVKLIETPAEPGTAWPPVLEATSVEIRPQVVGTVGFIGDANGLIYFYLDVAFARLVTCQLLGMSEAELEAAGDECVNDAIGELTNMTVGSFKNGLCDAGYPCMLTIPSILRGSNFCVEPISSAQRHIFRFDCAGHRVVTDILMKTGE